MKKTITFSPWLGWRRKLIYPLVLLLFFSLTANGQDLHFGAHCYFVSPSGDDQNPGSLSLPWQSLQKAAGTIEAGDTAIILGGTYQIDHEISFLHSGTDMAWITFMAMPGDTVIIDALNHVLDLSAPGPPYARDQGALMLVGVDYVRVEGMTIRNSRNSGITVRHSNHIEIRDNTIINTYDSGINAWENSQYLLITGNTIYKPNQFSMGQDASGNIVTSTGAPHEGLSIGDAQYFEVSFNEVSYGDKEGIDVKGPSRYGKVHDNYVHNHENHPFSVGIYVDAWTDSLYNIEVYNNVIHDCGDGVQIQSEDYRVVQNIYVHHNLCYNFYWSGLGVSNNSADVGGDVYTSDVIFRNNTVYNANDGFWLHGNIRDIVVENNIIAGSRRYQIDPRAGINTEANNIVFRYNQFSSEPEEPCMDCLYGDPGFINAAGHDFRLLADAPGINAGNPDPAFNDPDGSRNDLGYSYFSGYSYLTLRPWAPELPYYEGNDTLLILTNTSDFNISTEASWMNLLVSDSLLVIHASANMTGEDRSDTLLITVGSDTQKMAVAQLHYVAIESFELRNCPGGPLTAGTTMVKFSAKITPLNASNQDVVWYSSDESVISVDQAGLATALSAGEAWIRAGVENEDIADSCLVTVSPPEGIENMNDGREIMVGPNPVKNELIISNLFPGEKPDVTIFDLSGRPVIFSSGEEVVHLSALAKGIYFVRIRTDSGRRVYHKIVIE